MPGVAKHFNEKINYHWQQVVNFLKLHYVLNKRQDQAYWQDHCQKSSIPDSLRESLNTWKYRTPWQQDAPRSDELFSSASFQYVLYGMGFETLPTEFQTRNAEAMNKKAQYYFAKNQQQIIELNKILPGNRALHEKVMQYGFQRI